LKLILLESLNNLNHLYRKHHASAKRELRKLGCSSSVFEDLYQETFCILTEMQRQDRNEIKSPGSYIIQMCNYLWFKKRKRQEIKELLANMEVNYFAEAEENIGRIMLLIKHLKRISADCRDLLILYSLNYSEYKICRILKSDDGEAVNIKKYVCKEKLRDMIMKDPLFEEVYG
jgi:DNA-directed RNA polymerase specialized sigma24 family protein